MLSFVLLLISCGPTIHYLGDNYESSSNIDVYYSEQDVSRRFKTIGRLTHDKFISYNADLIKEAMVAEAKNKGADGIIFLDIYVEQGIDLVDDRLSIIATAIKYTDD